MICARSRPILTKTSTNSPHASRFFLHVLHVMPIMCHSDSAAASERSRPTRQRGTPPSAAAVRGRRLPWPGAAPRGSAGDCGRPGAPGPPRGPRAQAGLAPRRRRVDAKTAPSGRPASRLDAIHSVWKPTYRQSLARGSSGGVLAVGWSGA